MRAVLAAGPILYREVDVWPWEPAPHRDGGGAGHDGGTPAAPPWTIAGTLYRSGGLTPLAGGTIHLRDATGTTITLVSAQNGNFWTAQPVTFPLTASATRCADTRTMPDPVPLGSCNQGGCHETQRIELP